MTVTVTNTFDDGENGSTYWEIERERETERDILLKFLNGVFIK